MPETFEPPASPYVIDVVRGRELWRLFHQSQLFTTAMGELFPEALDLSEVERILDIGCGPGEWAPAVALAFGLQIWGSKPEENAIARSRRA